ncbi:MAG: metal-dependent transcriptional regulator [Nitrospinota bacterium]
MANTRKRSPEALSPSQEHYLRAIRTIEEEKGYARVTDIGNALGVAKATVSAAVKGLQKEGLVEHRHYEQVSLTPEGTRHAQQISSRFAIVQTFLEEVLGVQRDDALLDACLLEHYVSSRTIDRVIDLIRFFEQGESQEVLKRFRDYRRDCEKEESCRICSFNCEIVVSSDDLVRANLTGERTSGSD